MTSDPMPTALSPEDARDLTARIRATVALALDLVEQAYVGKAWKALGYASWSAYCGAEFTDLRRTRLSREERRDAALGWAAAGMSNRAIGHALGVDHHTAAADLAAGRGGEDSPPTRQEGVERIRAAFAEIEAAEALLATVATGLGVTVEELEALDGEDSPLAVHIPDTLEQAGAELEALFATEVRLTEHRLTGAALDRWHWTLDPDNVERLPAARYAELADRPVADVTAAAERHAAWAASSAGEHIREAEAEAEEAEEWARAATERLRRLRAEGGL